MTIQRYHVDTDEQVPDHVADIARRAVHRWAGDDATAAAELMAMLGIDGNTAPLRSSADRKARRRSTLPAAGTPLTENERATLHAYRRTGAYGATWRELELNERTVAKHLRRIRHKLGVECNTDLLELDAEAVA